MPRAEENLANVLSGISRALGRPVRRTERLRGGKNNRIYKITCDDSMPFVVKEYFLPRPGREDPLEIEFSALAFLWENGVRSVPQPVAADAAERWGVYAFVPGKGVGAPDIRAKDIAAAVAFLGRLRELSGSTAALRLPPASEACFSLSDVHGNLRSRLHRCRSVRRDGFLGEAFHRFMTTELLPAYRELARWSTAAAERMGLASSATLARDGRTLSPSDFGFHNALRVPSGEVVFLDFEYFGWDDPAKLISDFLHHPAMDLEEGLKCRFVSEALKNLGDEGRLGARLQILHPLFGLKWCLILLNEFLETDLRRRSFASGEPLEVEAVRGGQLVRSGRMLEKVMRSYTRFPYLN